jgi:hypothetical protein
MRYTLIAFKKFPRGLLPLAYEAIQPLPFFHRAKKIEQKEKSGLPDRIEDRKTDRIGEWRKSRSAMSMLRRYCSA